MPWEGWITCALVLVALVALARSAAAPDLVLLCTVVALTICGHASDRFLTPEDFARSFGNEGLLTVAVLFVVAAGLVETGSMSWIAARVLGRPRSVFAGQARLMAPVGLLSALLNNTPVVAMFVPVLRDWCRRMGFAPSKFLIPLSYAAVLGGTCTLIGTSTNLVVQGLLKESGQTPMGMFTITQAGLPAAIVGMLFVIVGSRWLLPDRGSPALASADPREYQVEMLVEPGSAIDGLSIERAGLRHLPGLYLAGIERGGDSLVAVGPEQLLRGDDRLQFVGIVDSVVDLQRVRGLRPATNQVQKLGAPRERRCLVEAVVSASSPLAGQTVREGRFRNRYDAAIIAVHRNGERIESKIGDIALRPGDNLLLEAHPSFVERHRHNRDFLLVSSIEDSHPRRHERAALAIAILLAMVIAASFEPWTGFSMLGAALTAACLLIATGCCSLEQARRSIEWPVLIAIGSAFGIGKALENSGAAGALAGGLIEACEPFGQLGLMIGVYFVTLVLTELVTNNAAAVLAFPIALAAAQRQGADFMPYAICVAMAASAGFATPIGYQTHLMVYGPGGYRFTDFLRIGLPLDFLVGAVTIAALAFAYG
jgi:di/tricarboxylate transporter